jgi:hypothetical protein
LLKTTNPRSEKVADKKKEKKEIVYSIYDKKEDTFEEYAVSAFLKLR